MAFLERFNPRPKAPSIEKGKSAFPADLNTLKTERSLGGSSGVIAARYEGNLYAIKKARSAHGDPKKEAWYKEQLKEEYVADKVYEALGFAVPTSRMYKDGAFKVSAFVQGEDLNSLDDDHRAKTSAELKRGFALDALMANWDVIGLVEDNIRLGEDGRVYRLDNGGSFRFRAQGEPKGASFGEKVGELNSLRVHNKLYADITEQEITQQIEALVQNREKILQTMERSGKEAAIEPESLKELLETTSKRISYLEKSLVKAS